MFAHVKYLDDNISKTVPISYIYNFNVNDWSPRFVYQVFRSPEGVQVDSVPDFVSLEDKKEDKSGFYKAVVLKLAESKEEMAEELAKSRIKFAPSKLIEENQTEEAVSSVEKYKQEYKGRKELKKKRMVKNTREILKLRKVEKNKPKSSPSRKKVLKKTSLFGSSDSDVSILHDSEDDVVPKKMYTDLKKKFEDYKKKEAERYMALDCKYQKMKSKVEKLTELNLKLQSKFFGVGETEEKKLIPASYDESVAGASQSSTIVHPASTVSCTPPQKSFEEVHMDEPMEHNQKDGGMNRAIIPASIDETVSVNISSSKLLLAKQVKRGKAGDSQFTKNLASLLWETDVLEKRSVTGRKCNALKGVVEAKKALTPQKMNKLKQLFKERIIEENPAATREEVDLRSANINQYIAQKIATLNRKVKLINE